MLRSSSCMALVVLLALFGSANVQALNPETFETHTVGQDLTPAEGWGANGAGLGNPDPARHGIVAGQALELTDPDDVNFDMFWTEAFLSGPQILRYDVRLTNASASPERSLVVPAPAPISEFIMEVKPGGMTLLGRDSTNSTYVAESLPTAVSLDTWYSVQVEVNTDADTVRARAGLQGGTLSSWTSLLPLSEPSVDPVGNFVRFTANDTVAYDNISLVVVPEPAVWTLLLTAGIASACWLRRRR